LQVRRDPPNRNRSGDCQPVHQDDARRMELDEFGELLSAQVRRQGLTMAEFAAKVGLSASTLSRVRTGARPPTQAQAERWAKALALDGDARSDFVAAAMLARTPAPVREKLRQVEAHARDAHRDRTRLESDYGSYRSRTGFHDGWWLSYSLSFRCDGRVQRSLLHFAGGEATLQVRDSGMLLYSYHGSCEPLGDKLFVRVVAPSTCRSPPIRSSTSAARPCSTAWSAAFPARTSAIR
jgi:transcriptional regulator with XRE-family HTH domain